jgi:hypothetical protein
MCTRTMDLGTKDGQMGRAYWAGPRHGTVGTAQARPDPSRDGPGRHGTRPRAVPGPSARHGGPARHGSVESGRHRHGPAHGRHGHGTARLRHGWPRRHGRAGPARHAAAHGTAGPARHGTAHRGGHGPAGTWGTMGRRGHAG